MTRTRLLVRLAAAAIFAGLFGWLALRMVRPDREAFGAALSSVRLEWLALYFAITIAAQSARTARWATLLRPLGGVPLRRLVPISLVGYMAQFTLPALGEVVRPYLVRDRAGLRGTAALATVVVERVFDGLFVAIAAFFALVPLRGRPDAPWVDAVCFGTLAFFSCGLATIVTLRWKRAWAFRACDRLLSPVSPRLAGAVRAKMESFVEGLAALPDRGVALRAVGWTLIYWAMNGWAVQALAWGFGIILDLQATWATIGVVVLAFFVPAPAQIGTFHYFLALGLGLFLPAGQMRGAGAAFTVAAHGLQTVMFVGAGLLALFSREVRWWRHAAPAAAIAAALLLPGVAEAKSARTIAASYDAVWSAAVRYVRVDRGFAIRDKDRESGYLLFDWESDGKKLPASVELARKGGDGKDSGDVVVHARCDDLPRYEEIHFLDRLEEKVRAEGARPEQPKEPKEPKEPPREGGQGKEEEEPKK